MKGIEHWFKDAQNVKALFNLIKARFFAQEACADDIQDLFQEVSVELLKSGRRMAAKGNPLENPLNLARRIIPQKIERMLKALHARPASIEEIAGCVDPSEGFEENLQKKISYEDALAAVDKVLDAKPLVNRRIYLMHLVEGMTFKEIAIKLEISENTIRTKFYRTEKCIREAINGEDRP